MNEIPRLGDAAATGITVLIPAWQPGPALTTLARELRDAGVRSILVVDDGSHPASAPVFAALDATDGVRVVRHATNLGKGRALKTGVNALLVDEPALRGVVTADADGQHTAHDIVRVIAAFHDDRTRVVLGVRRFDGTVPLRSRVGNAVTTAIFRFLTGKNVTDTQSGLRAFPAASLAALLTISGERYEYEMGVLSHVCREETPREITIATVYLDGNATSHFDPLRDSLRISFVLLRFYASSLIAAALDTIVFGIVYAFTGSVPVSFAAGRSSSLVNFALNRRYVFRSQGSIATALIRYYLLVVVIAVAAYTSIGWLTTVAHWNVFAAKLVVESLLSLVSFSVQRSVVFLRRGAVESGAG